ncbi:hypothetical protein GGS20DRAFT_563897 [Poronia punctata]|nr:hypothetical protein GGS20DRAFT_563897 [Poronia punctata]
MPPMPCANAPSAARSFLQLCARRSAASSFAAAPGSSCILDVLIPPTTQARAFSICAARNNPSSTIPRIRPNGNGRRHALMSRNTFSTSRSLARTLAIHNAQKDEEGNEMVLEITPRAADRLSQIMSKDKNPHLALRIQVESGGCHGFQYIMSLTTLPPTISPEAPHPPLDREQVTEDVAPSTTTKSSPSPPSLTDEDTIFAFALEAGEAEGKEKEALLTGPKIVLDLPSLELLKGSKVDYTMELIGSQFKIVDNPLATSSCGCGTSFDIKA